jgi:PAS domain S-box-containing protein
MAASGKHISSLSHQEFFLGPGPREAALRFMPPAFQDKTSAVAGTMPVLVIRIDRDYRIDFVTRGKTEEFAYGADDFFGRRLPDILGAESFERVRHIIDAVLEGQAREQEITLEDHTGKLHRLQLTLLPDCDGDEHNSGGTPDRGSQPCGLIVVISDVTRLRHTEEELQRRDTEFRTLVEHSPDIITRMDRNMRHLYVNPAIQRLARIDSKAYIGKTKGELGLPASLVEAWDAAAKAAFETRQEQRLDFDLQTEGQQRYFSGRIIPEPGPHGQFDSVIGIAYEVTERARIQKENEELLVRERSARIQAETAAKARDEFLSIVSHELRAPLNGIQSWAHVLESYLKDVTSVPLAQRALKGIKTGINQQVRLIEDLLDVTRMMSGRLRLVKQPLALLPLLRAAIESVHDMAAAKKVELKCDYRITTEQIEGDSDRIQQIVWNLLDNAVKFTPAGGHVWLGASQAEGMICVTVRDDGVGISPDFLPSLFDRFTLEDSSSTRSHDGLGLGLFLVRHLVELHGGKVKAESAGEGMGTTFTVQFPLRLRTDKYAVVFGIEDNAMAKMSLPSLSGLRILLVDDQAEARESLTIVLAAAGANIHSAACGKDAMSWLEGLPENERPDVLVCDIAMPEEDGYSVLRKLRNWSPDGRKPPLERMPALALTAFAEREDRIRALTAGFQMHVTKPVAPEELIVVIDTMVSRERPALQ